MPELWVPGAAGPSLEDFVKRLNAAVESFAKRRGTEEALVEIQLHDGSRHALHSIRPEPGYGFITVCPYPEDQAEPWPGAGEGECPPKELIVPVGSIVRITLGEPAERPTQFGFSVPEAD